MSDSAVATVDTSGSLGRALSGMGESMARELPRAMEESRAQSRELRDVARAGAAAIDKGIAERGALPKPPMPPPNPPPQYQETSMGDKWGSLAMGMAVLGSAFTRRPATNSLNAAAGVLNAYHDSDAAAYKRNFDQWKAATDYSLKMYEYQRDAYKDAISNINQNTNDAMAKVRMIAASLGDDPMKNMAAMGNVAGVLMKINEYNARLPLLEAETAIARQRGELVQQFNTAREALRANPNDPAAQQAMREVLVAADELKKIEGKGTVTDQRLQQENDLRSKLIAEWQAANPGKPMTATIEADITAKAKGAVAGKTETATSARERALSAAVEADVERFKLENPEATQEQIDKARFDSRLKHEGELGRAVRQPRSASAMSLDAFINDFFEKNGRRPTPEEIQTFQAQGIGKNQEARTVGARSASLELAGEVADAIIPLAKDLSKKVSRTDYPDLNKIILSYETRTGDPDVVRFGEMVNTLTIAFARALSPTGQLTVDMSKRVDGILNKAWSDNQFSAALDQMQVTIRAEKQAIENVRSRIAGGGAASHPAPAAAAAPATSPAVSTALGGPPTVTNQQQYDTLPKGAEYKDSGGKLYRKK